MTSIPPPTSKVTMRLVFDENESGSRNANRYYIMNPVKNGRFTCDAGRVGSAQFNRTYFYNETDWGHVFATRMKHGYTVINVSDESAKIQSIEQSCTGILAKLKAYATGFFKNNYSVRVQEITQQMIDRASELINELKNTEDLSSFNRILCTLFCVIPREMHRVSDYTAHSLEDMKHIIKREEEYLETVSVNTVENTEKELPTERVDDNLIIRDVTSSEMDEIKKLFGPESYRIANAWSVTNKKTQKVFDSYAKAKGNIRKLFHGSRNENFYSIVKNGLCINPHATNGRMFGNGIYFAPKSTKSLGYTSICGSYWAHGSSNTGYLGIYDVALGKMYESQTCDSVWQNHDFLKKYDSYYCYRGNALRNDEAVVYTPSAQTIRYLVEIK